MKFINLIKTINISYGWGLLKLFLVHPIYGFPTLSATKKCIQLANSHYGKLHHKDNLANAFRHALWSYLLAKKAYQWKKNKIKAKAWAKIITDYHEDIMPNPPLMRAMDSHNNAIGIELFKTHSNFTTSEIVTHLKTMTKEAKKITKPSDIALYKTKLVYIINL